MPIPFLSGILDSVRLAQILSSTLFNNPALVVRERIAGTRINQTAESNSASNLNSLNSCNVSNAKIIGSGLNGAINHLITTLLPNLSHTFDNKASKISFGLWIKGKIKASKPIMAFINYISEAKVTITISGLEGGLEIAFSKCKWIPLVSPSVNFTLKHILN